MIGTLLITSILAVPLDAATAVQKAWTHSAELAALKHALAEARASVDGAERWRNPTLRLSTFRSDRLVSSWLGDGQYRAPLDGVTLAVRWKPPHPGVNAARTARAERRLEQARLRWISAHQAIAQRVRKQHAITRNLQARAEVARQTLAAARASLELVKRQRAAQTATALQLDIIQLDLLAAQRQADDLETQHAQALLKLRRAIGLDEDSPITLVQAEPLCVQPPATPPVVKGDDPALAIFEARRAELRAKAALAKAEGQLGLDFVQLGFRFAEGTSPLRMTNPVECKGQCDDPAHIGLSLGITLPVFDTHTPRVRAIDSGLARLTAESSAKRRALDEDMHRNWAQWQRAYALYQDHLAAEALIDSAEKRLQASLEAGVADPIEVVQVRKRIARTRRATLRVALRCSRARLAADPELVKHAEDSLVSFLAMRDTP